MTECKSCKQWHVVGTATEPDWRLPSVSVKSNLWNSCGLWSHLLVGSMSIMKSSSIVVAMLALVFASGAFAQHTFAPFTVTPVGTTNFDTVLNVASVPAGTYTSFQVTVSWTAIAGNPFSNEARTSFTNGGATTHFAEAAPTTGG